MEQWSAWRCESEVVMTALAESETGLAALDALADYDDRTAVPGSPEPADELMQVGYVGLMKAIVTAA
jgi:hypothetical protein